MCVCVILLLFLLFFFFLLSFYKWQQCITHIFTSPSLHSAAASSSFCSEVPFVVCVCMKAKTHSNSRYINNKTEPNNTHFDYTIVRALGRRRYRCWIECLCVCIWYIYILYGQKCISFRSVVFCGFCSDQFNYKRLLEIHWHFYNSIRNSIGNDISDYY